jgi:PPM family protein phosphatase
MIRLYFDAFLAEVKLSEIVFALSGFIQRNLRMLISHWLFVVGLFLFVAIVICVSGSVLRTRPCQVKLKVGVVSLRGKVREINEDNYYVPGLHPVRPDRSGESGEIPVLTLGASNLFIVADGMGGQQAGEKASLMAVELIPRAIASRLGAEDTEPGCTQKAIQEGVAEVNSEILRTSGLVSELSKMGTTIVLAQFRQDRVYVAGIGDSRAYRLRDGKLEQLTRDHSLAQALVDSGTIPIEELATHRFKNVLYLFLGCKDAQGGPEEIRVLNVRPDDRFLLATDGLTGVVSDADLAHVLVTVNDPQQAASMLANLALRNDSHDNVTCLAVYLEAQNAPAFARSAT